VLEFDPAAEEGEVEEALEGVAAAAFCCEASPDV
jgi:hypothetical protein